MALPSDPAVPMPIFLDFQATTPLDPRILPEMLPYLSGPVGNPHSTSNLHGLAAHRAVETARVEVAALLGARPDEVAFTSGATEANNMLIRGAAETGRRSGRSAVVTCATEHKAVLDVVERLAGRGMEARVVPVLPDGQIDLARLSEAIDDRVSVVSVMAANNEIGVLQPLREISRLCRVSGALFHTDAAQALGKVPFDVADAGVDLASASAHKLYGPMGIGAAFVSRRARALVEPLMHGGGQEGGLRSGTLPVALCVGFGAACRIAAAGREDEMAALRRFSGRFVAILRERDVAFHLNGHRDRRLPGNLNLRFPGIDAEALLMRVRSSISISSGSACTSASIEPSHVVAALGGGPEVAEESVRIGFGRSTTIDEVVTAAETVAAAVAALGRVVYRRLAEG